MALLIALLMFALLAVAIAFFGYHYYARPGRYYEQLGVVAHPVGSLDGSGQSQAGGMVRIFRIIGEKVPISPGDATVTRRLLIAAGFREDAALYTYYGIQVIVTVLLPVIVFVLKSSITPIPTLQTLLVIAAAGAGFFLPGLILEHLVGRRQEEIKLSLPDALDLLVVCVEAGLGLDQAIVNVAKELQQAHPELCEEFGLMTLEMQAGKRRAEALRNLADRTREAELRKLVSILVQTDRFGTSMAESLRTHSDFLRIRRRQEAEERANKVGVKLVFPIFFCILPSMLVVVAGPGLLQVFKYLFPMMRQFRV
ncbi:MAG: type II secretion system F family protein [Acidobacteria bacterium]|nr:type II secretion system F family protein [Acidobacteriota bacterium]